LARLNLGEETNKIKGQVTSLLLAQAFIHRKEEARVARGQARHVMKVSGIIGILIISKGSGMKGSSHESG